MGGPSALLLWPGAACVGKACAIIYTREGSRETVSQAPRSDRSCLDTLVYERQSTLWPTAAGGSMELEFTGCHAIWYINSHGTELVSARKEAIAVNP